MLDTKILFFLNDLAGRFWVLDKIIVFFADYLKYPLMAVFLIFLYFQNTAKQEKFKIFWTAALSGIIAKFGIVELIRYIYHRPRPFLVYNVKQLVSENNYSFPSGHAAFFFALSTAVYLYNKRAGKWFLGASFLISISRVIAGAHYPSDIIGGMIVGTVVAYIFVKIIENLTKKNN